MRRLSALAFVLVALTMPSGAQAPATPLAVRQTAYLKASNADPSDHFGCGGVVQGHTGQGVALSADGRTLAVGAPHEGSHAIGVNGNQGDNSTFDAGAVYVFIRAGTAWAQQAYIKPSNPQTGAEFGHYVALSADGNTLAVSAYWEASNATGINGNQKDESIPQAGAVYVFTRQGATWRQQSYVKASNTGEAGTADSFGEGDQFGFSLALSGDGCQRRSEEQRRAGGRCRLCVHARRREVVAAGVCETIEHRRRRFFRLCRLAECRWHHARRRRV